MTRRTAAAMANSGRLLEGSRALASSLVFVLRQYYELTDLPDTTADEAVYEWIRDRLAERDALQTKIQAVRALHGPTFEFPCCEACHLYTDEQGGQGPCKTRRLVGE